MTAFLFTAKVAMYLLDIPPFSQLSFTNVLPLAEIFPGMLFVPFAVAHLRRSTSLCTLLNQHTIYQAYIEQPLPLTHIYIAQTMFMLAAGFTKLCLFLS